MRMPGMKVRSGGAIGVVVVCAAVVAVAGGAPASFGDRSGNYLIVTASDYLNSAPLNEFIAAKTGQGFRVMVYEATPGTSRSAIKDYIESLWGTPDAPDYLLLVGDTDGSSATTNTVPHWVGAGPRAATTDLPYACMDPGDDWFPDFAWGRWSVRSVDQLQDVVDKSLFVESGNYPDPNYVMRVALLATSDMSSGGEEAHDWVVSTYLDPAEYESIKIYERLGGDTGDVANAVNRGCVITVYFGHSSSSGWWGPSFSQSDVRALHNTGLYGLVFGFSCNTAHFDYDECFGETWLRQADKGAAAYLSASDYIYYQQSPWHESQNLEKFFFQSFFEDGIWEVGPAWRLALQRLLDLYGPTSVIRDHFEMFVLLGDPSLRLPQPAGFDLLVSPTSQSVCAPPDNEATFTVEVRQFGDFNEVVTLSADGLPPGASASFNPNALPPPFTAELTISDIIPGSPGDYDIAITGTAKSEEHTTSAHLNLSDGVPEAVILLDPPDGATDVPREPTLVWEPAAQAAEYYLQIATDPAFVQVVYSASTADTTHTVGQMLESATLYYWRVRGTNACGDGPYSAAFRFTTIEQPDYFTEQFDGDFDLDNFSVSFIPDGSGDYYMMCGGAIDTLPTDPAGGTRLYLGDDRYEQVILDDSRTVRLYNLSYTNFYVGSNGYITFGSGDTDYTEELDDHFDLPRISALFDDLNPESGGTISWKQLDDRAVVTYENVPEWGTTNSNTFQIEMFFEGKIRVSWLRIDCTDAIAGLSEGHGLPGDFIESDLSSAQRCCRGDFDGDGYIGLSDLAILLGNYPMPDGAEYEDGDFDEDGDVDLSDLAALLSVYNTECP